MTKFTPSIDELSNVAAVTTIATHNNSTPLHVEVVGQGPAIVLIHGWGLNAGVWHQVVDKLALDYRVYTIDLPGFGLSEQPLVSTELADWVDLAVAAIDEPAVWLGWSLGGLVATQAALTYPERVTQLITVASSPHFVAQANWPGIAAEVLATFEQQLADDFAATLDRFLAIQAMGSVSARQDIKALHQVLKQRPLPDPRALKVGLNLLATVDLRQQLPAINQPFLRLYGRLDSLVSSRAVKKIDLLVPNSDKFVFAKASHAPFITDLELFIEQLNGFICTA